MLKTYTTLFFLLSFNLFAETINKLQVNGNDRISKETIRVYGDIILGKNYSATEINVVL
jgi:hypothetical protein